jgi:hypothetical protein
MRHQHCHRARVALYALVIGIGVTAWSMVAAESHTPPKSATVQEVVAHYASIVHANYEDVYRQALALQAALQVFVANPSASPWKQQRVPGKERGCPMDRARSIASMPGPLIRLTDRKAASMGGRWMKATSTMSTAIRRPALSSV